jgi:hypothetical protein
MEDKVAHLQMIQGVIQRMGQNSFALKGWCVTIVAALFALTAKDANTRVGWVALIPIITLGFLDAYYVWQERRFRDLFDAVAAPDSGVLPFSMRPDAFSSRSFGAALRSASIWAFYIGLLVLAVLALALLQSSPSPASANKDSFVESVQQNEGQTRPSDRTSPKAVNAPLLPASTESSPPASPLK